MTNMESSKWMMWRSTSNDDAEINVAIATMNQVATNKKI